LVDSTGWYRYFRIVYCIFINKMVLALATGCFKDKNLEQLIGFIDILILKRIMSILKL